MPRLPAVQVAIDPVQLRPLRTTETLTGAVATPLTERCFIVSFNFQEFGVCGDVVKVAVVWRSALRQVRRRPFLAMLQSEAATKADSVTAPLPPRTSKRQPVEASTVSDGPVPVAMLAMSLIVARPVSEGARTAWSTVTSSTPIESQA